MPAAVAVHGHGYGSREIVGLRQDGSSDPEPPGIHQHFAVQLVRRGMVVIAPDVAGFGERRLAADLARNPEAANSCHRLSTQLLMHGKTLAGLRVAETLRALDYLAERPEVQPDRIGIMGFSGGGLISFLCAALDERIRAAVLAGYPNTFKDSIMAVQHCICNYIPGMLSHAELPEWIGLISPDPCIWNRELMIGYFRLRVLTWRLNSSGTPIGGPARRRGCESTCSLEHTKLAAGIRTIGCVLNLKEWRTRRK